MDHQFLHEIYDGVKDIDLFFRLMINIMPSNEIKIIIIVFNPTLSNDRSAYIMDNVVNPLLIGFSECS